MKKVKINLTKLKRSILSKNGGEYHNPQPKVHNTGLNRPPTLQQQIQRLLKNEMSLAAEKNDMETFDESNDFDITDEFDQSELESSYQLLQEEIPDTVKEKEIKKQARPLESVEASEHRPKNEGKAEVSPEPKPEVETDKK